MELQRGVCSLCGENGRVFTPPDAEEINKFLPQILYENFLTDAAFQKMKDSIKVCPVCCFKVQTANETRKAIKNAAVKTPDSREKTCHFCKNDEYIIKVRDNWKYFVLRSEGFLKITDFPVCVCLRCIFYFDTIFNIKTNLIKKFPQLAVPVKSTRSSLKEDDTPKKQNDTPKRKSLSKSPPSSKKRKIFNDCFSYLQPLCNNNYYVDDALKIDSRLYEKIAYVNLKDVKNITIKETPKVRPIIKIKLKAKNRRGPKEKLISKVVSELSEDIGFRTQPYVKLCKSEDTTVKKSKARRYSCHLEERPIEKDPDENLEETPKAASDANLVPKRRVSLFVEPNDEDNEEIADTQVNMESSEKVDKIVEKYIKDSTFNDDNKLDLLEEIGDNKVNSPIEENGVDKAAHVSEDVVDTETEQTNDETKSEEDAQDTSEQKNLENERSDSSLSKDSERKTSSKSDSSGEDSSDSDASDKFKNKDNADKDSLNGSERKKKRVTFSDEIN